MATLDDLVIPLRAHAPGASLGLLKQAFREAARKFFQESTAWREEVAPSVGANNGTYTLAPPTDAEVFDASGVWKSNGSGNPTRLTKKTRAQIQHRYDNGTAVKVFRIGAADTLHIAPAPDTDISSELIVHGILRPTRAADTLDDEMTDRFEEALLDGARWKILLMPQEWRNPSMAEYYRKLFQDAIDRAHALAADDGQKGVHRLVKYGGL